MGAKMGSNAKAQAGAKPGAKVAARSSVAIEGSLNQVLLVGRMSGQPTVRALPSGDEITTWRVVVDRAPDAATARGPRAVDTIDCVAYKRGVRKLAATWAPGDVLEIRGALRRRFWRGAAGLASRCEVEVEQARRLRSPARG